MSRHGGDCRWRIHATLGRVRLIDGPQITQDILRRFTELVEQAQRSEISADTLQEQASKLDSKLGDAVAGDGPEAERPEPLGGRHPGRLFGHAPCEAV